MNFWADFTPPHVAALILVGILLYNVVQRIRAKSENHYLTAANLVLAVTLFSGLPPVYQALDTAMGGRNYVNLLAHLGVISSGWLITRFLGKTYEAYSGTTYRSKWLSAWWLVGIAGIAVFSFLGLKINGTTRGLDRYDHEFLYGIYHGVTYLGLGYAFPHIGPKLRLLLQDSLTSQLRLMYRLFYVSYLASLAAAVLCLLATQLSWLHGLREIAVYTTGFSVAFGFLLANLGRKDHRAKK